MKFLCWIPDNGSTIEDAEPVEADDAREAAENYVERRFADMDYPNDAEVAVSDGESTDFDIYEVIVEMSPTFRAQRKKKT